MESALGWLGDIFKFIFSLFPHIVIVRKTHAGICWRYGAHERIWDPGLHVYWPLVSEYELYPTVEQTINLQTQTLVTADNCTIAVGGIIQIRIDRVGDILGKVFDPEQTVSDVCMVALRRVITQRTMDELRKESDRLDGELQAAVQAKVAAYGVYVLAAALSDFSPCFVVKLWGDEGAVRHRVEQTMTA